MFSIMTIDLDDMNEGFPETNLIITKMTKAQPIKKLRRGRVMFLMLKHKRRLDQRLAFKMRLLKSLKNKRRKAIKRPSSTVDKRVKRWR